MLALWLGLGLIGWVLTVGRVGTSLSSCHMMALWRVMCDSRCTSGFVDDGMFSRNALCRRVVCISKRQYNRTSITAALPREPCTRGSAPDPFMTIPRTCSSTFSLKHALHYTVCSCCQLGELGHRLSTASIVTSQSLLVALQRLRRRFLYIVPSSILFIDSRPIKTFHPLTQNSVLTTVKRL